MSKVIALVSKSARLLISLHNNDCEFSISDDYTTLLLHPRSPRPISSTHPLTQTSGSQEIQSYDFPCHTRGRMGSVRIDAILSTVFEDSEEIECILLDSFQSASHQPTGDLLNYGLLVKLNFDGELSPPTLTKITSVSLTVESTTVPVSKEVLGTSSDFFSNLFYGDFVEKKTGSFCIKEVNEEHFSWLVRSITERKWNVTSVDQALSVLTLADRYLMQNVHKRILPYLKTTELDSIAENRIALLKRFLDLATRCSDNGEFVSWIFERCQTTTELSEVAHSCGTTLTPHLEMFFQVFA
ncbi:hypothetical protein PMAYCL1PPCAC_08817, partial [Pristionchus mayeri]